MKRLLVVLQNPYDKGELQARRWHPTTWRKEFERSRAGTRLRYRALPDESVLQGRLGWVQRWKYHYANANPTVGDGSRARHGKRLSHVRRALKRVEPDIVLACGQEAEEALRKVWDGALLVIPHPSYMCLTNSLLDRCKVVLSLWRHEGSETHQLRIALRQRRGYVSEEAL